MMNKSSVAFPVLASCIAQGDVASLRSYLLNKNVSPNDCDEDGQTLLMIAAQYGQVAVVNEFLAHGADVNAEDVDNWTALTNAAKAGCKDIVVKLLDHGADIEHRDMGQWTPLMWACYKGHYYVVKILLERGAMVNVLDKNHCTPLIWAAGRGYLEIVEILLERGAKVYSTDKYGTTSLVWACRKGFTDIVHVLLDASANVDTAGMFSWTPLLVAAKGNHASIANMLLEHKPNVNAVDMDGCTALSIACKEGYTEIAKALMNAGAYINLPDRNGDTNLIHAAKAGHFSIVDALIRKYADIDLAGADGKTALYWATEKGYTDIVRLLLSANPNCEIATKDGDTPLLKATRNRNAEIVQLLVDKKCKVSASDKKGDTALHIAMRARSKAIVEILLRNPKNSQLLYRPNRAGETPYNIDTNHQKSILAQIFGARRLNTNEDSENRLGYELYSSALADILSEPSLSMPISVGLYAKWGSGKSFLLKKLENEMKSFVIQWLEPMFEFSHLVVVIVLLISVLGGLIMSLATRMWFFGGCVSIAIFVSALVFLGGVIYCNKNYDFSWMYQISLYLATQLNSLRTLLFVIFCSPPANKRDTHTNPVRFLFTEQTKVTSSGSDNSIIQIVISLHAAVEKEYGLLTSRMYRVLKPRPVASQRWRYRRLCCIPNFIIAFMFILSIAGIAILLVETDAAAFHIAHTEWTTVFRSALIVLSCITVFIVLGNIYSFLRILTALIISHQRRISHALLSVGTSKSKNYVISLKNEVDTIVQMVQCLDAFVGQQTRLVIIVDGLDSCEQEKVLHVLDAMHLLFSDSNSPFVIILAIDPHIIIKAIESNIHRVFEKSNINGYEYLRNVVHLPFYLQNSGLRRVKASQQAALLWSKKSANYWNEDKECDRSAAAVTSNRKASNSSMSIPDAFKKRNKGNQKLKASDSLASSISNLHRMVTGAQDLSKVLLTDDYFSDVNPRSMRRLMNIVYITGRLLKAFNIDFNWYHLASWVNITEQWPYRTSWIIMYYEMHENEFDEMLPLKTVYEKIKCYMPISKEQEPTLDLDHDERKFEVFLSFHSSSLLINDLKVFLPFTINLDPYIRKVIQENHQEVSEFLKIDLKPSNSPPTKMNKSENLRMKNRLRPHLVSPLGEDFRPPIGYLSMDPDARRHEIFPHQISPPVYQSSTSPWWNFHGEPLVLHSDVCTVSKPNQVVPPDLGKLSSLSVGGVQNLLKSQDKLTKKKLDFYLAAIEESNINGQVLLTCDLKELKDILNMSFGDWELFRVLIITLREQEMSSGGETSRPENRLLTAKQLSVAQPSGNNSPEVRHKEITKMSKLGSDAAENILHKNRSSFEKQVTMEESMIVGALETLSEEALEDAMEEQNYMKRKSIPNTGTSNPLSPILSDAEEVACDEKLTADHMPVVAVTPSDVDMLYLRSLQNSPALHVSTISLSDSLTDVETSSVDKSQSTGCMQTWSSGGDSSSLSRRQIKGSARRPSSLVYDPANPVIITETGNSRQTIIVDKSARKSHDKTVTLQPRSKHSRRKSMSKSNSDDSSTETDETKPLKKIPPQKVTPTPVSDGFYSDDEHTPLVSPFHQNRSSHYNLQSSKQEKESTPEKSIPKQSKSDTGPNRKSRKPLERQFSIDSNMCGHARLPTSSSSMVDISSPPGLPVYGQHVSDSYSPDLIQAPSDIDNQVHNETVL